MTRILPVFAVLILSLIKPAHTLEDLGYTQFCCSAKSGCPENVHEVRPADIKVVGALGDSRTAAFGAGATSEKDLAIDYRGLSFSIGGAKTLEEHVSVPNILKKFNPRVFGQSYGSGPVDDWPHAQLNAAVSGARAIDMLTQAKDLVLKMLLHPDKVELKHDWKLIHIYIGRPDACDYCKLGPVNGVNSSPRSYKAYIERAVKFLHDNVPRTIVSIIGMSNIQVLGTIEKLSPTCKQLHQKIFPCACITNQTLVDPAKLCRDYQKAVLEIQNEGKYEKDDFTVVVQPTFENIFQPPLNKNGTLNTVFFAPDCYHLSQYGHAVVAKMLWNNLLQPVGSKVSNYNLSDPNIPLLCPKWSCPYIRTKRNSKHCKRIFYRHERYDYSQSDEVYYDH